MGSFWTILGQFWDQPLNQPSLQPTKPSTNQAFNQSSLQPTKPSTNQLLNQPTLQSTNPSTYQPFDRPAPQPTRPVIYQLINQPTLQPTNTSANQHFNQPALRPNSRYAQMGWWGYAKRQDSFFAIFVKHNTVCLHSARTRLHECASAKLLIKSATALHKQLIFYVFHGTCILSL